MHRPTLFAVAALAIAGLPVSAAQASFVAYVDNGEVWAASPDGATKVRLAEQFTFTDSEGRQVTQKYLDVAASDSGRVVGVRNEPGKISQLSRFRVIEPNGATAHDGALPYTPGWTLYAYPVGLDFTADGNQIVYGYSQSANFGASLDTGTYVNNVTNVGGLEPIRISGKEWPTVVGSRIVAKISDTSNAVQQPTGIFSPDFDPWLSYTLPAGTDEITRTEVAADGKVMALETQTYNGGQQSLGKIDVLPLDQLGGTPDNMAGCTLVTNGVAKSVSLSQDHALIAWEDSQGVWVAGSPVFTGADACQLSSPPVLLSATARHPSIGPGSAAAFAPAPAPTPGTPTPSPTPGPTGPGTTTTPGATTTPTPASSSTAPSFTVPSKGLSATALTSSAGLSFKVTVRRAGKVSVKLTVAPKVLGRKGTKAITIATGSATAKKAGSLTVKLKRTSAAKGKAKRLRKKKGTLTVTQAGRSTKRTVTLK